jgi:polysaccharide chain length determinant protein (PEP-CTERM system associated)
MLPGKTYSPVDYAAMAWRRRWVIVVPMLVFAYGALLISTRLHDLYKSETLIQVVPQRVPNSYVQSTVSMRTEDRLNALSQQVLSRTALETLITDMKLYPEERRRYPMQDVVDLMRTNISVDIVASKAGQGADAFYVRFSYADRDLATRVTERLGSLFIDMNARDRGALAEATDQFLQSQLADTRRALEAQERRLEQFRERNAGRLPTQLAFNMQGIQTTQLSIQAIVESVARDRDRKMMLERLYNDAHTESVAPALPTVAMPSQPSQSSDPTTAASGLTAEQQLAAARDALSKLELRLKPEHPDIARMQRLIKELEARAADDRAVAKKAAAGQGDAPAPPAATAEQLAKAERLRQMRAEIESLDRQIGFKDTEEQRQREQLAEYQHRIEQVPGIESEWTALTRDYDTQQAAYKDLLAKSEQSKVAVQLERRQIGEQFKILDPARPPVRPTGLRRLQVNGAGAALGLAFGFGLAALLEFRDRTFKKSEDVREVIKLPVLAELPHLTSELERNRARRTMTLAAAAAVLAVSVAGYGMYALQLWKFVK